MLLLLFYWERLLTMRQETIIDLAIPIDCACYLRSNKRNWWNGRIIQGAKRKKRSKVWPRWFPLSLFCWLILRFLSYFLSSYSDNTTSWSSTVINKKKKKWFFYEARFTHIYRFKSTQEYQCVYVKLYILSYYRNKQMKEKETKQNTIDTHSVKLIM